MALEKDKAAAFLGCSPRQLERYAKDNRIGVTYESEPGRTRKKPMYDESELQRLKGEIAAPVIKPMVSPHNPQNELATDSDGALSALVGIGQGIGDGSKENAFLALLSHVASQSAQETAKAIIEAQRVTSAPDAVALSAQTFVSKDEAARLIGVSRGAIDRAIKAGELVPRSGLARGHRLKVSEIQDWAKAL